VNTRRLRTADGVELALYRLSDASSGRGRPALLLVHGAFSSHTVWRRGRHPDGGLAQHLSGRGFDVWLADLRHHGASDREPRPRTWRFEDLIEQDAPAVIARVRQETDGAPLAWLGHSSGGAVGIAWAARQTAAPRAGPPPLAALVTFGTPGPRGMSPIRRGLALGTIALCRAMGRFPSRALRLGPEDEAALVLGDWMGWNTRGRWVGRDGFDYLAALAAARTPFLGVAGEGDRLFAPAAACREVVDLMGAERKTLVVAGPDLDHRGMLVDPRARERCWPMVSDWLEETLM
jgi:pimeloyl-ACP methyl ester carboxylesterase